MKPSAASSQSAFVAKWGRELARHGYTQVSNFFLENYHRMKPHALTHAEAMFAVHLLRYRLTDAAPFPSYATIARQMGVSVKTARRHAQSLERKKCLFRTFRVGRTNSFQLDALVNVLMRFARGTRVVPPRGGRRKR